MEMLNDILGYDNLKIYQDTDFFSFSLDSIVLANYSTVRLRDKKILDFCTGNGIVPIIVSRRTKSNIFGVEIQDKLVDLAKKSISYNNLNDRISIICDDVKNFSNANLNCFDLVLCNPPYFKVHDNSSLNLSYEKKVARHEVCINLTEICECAKKVLKDNGSFSIVYRSDRLIELIDEFRKHGIEPKKVKFVYEKVDKNANLVLLQGQKCGKVGLTIEKPLIMYNDDGSMTDEYSKLNKEILV
ncbi:MAG: tRNA1(Val) (adenine(37)-N6)-methyltransferase [Bacilli bacterium]|nr:tRNA1(Val) (adenine(37)-N6)-methyltransferase [Bacilli bacterium]MBR1936711.1 tRNA1(Val) (adenine(37)-N6)-methyltransferase [Bacilli bacterium]